MAKQRLTQRQQLGERSRDRILDVAARLMARHGYDGASVALLSRESGLPASSIYWHFESKEGVLAAVMERGAERFFSDVDASPPAGLQGVERIRVQMRLSSEAIARHPDFMRLFILLLLTRHADQTVRRVRAKGRQRLHALLRDAYLHEGKAAADAIADRLADVALAMFDGAFLAVQNNPRLSYEPLLLHMGEALAALAAQTPATRPARRLNRR